MSKALKDNAIELSSEDLQATNLSKPFDERSDIAQEIISRKPDFYEKWALSFFCVLLLLVSASTWFIKYPDIIEASAILTGDNAPKEIISKQSGRLTTLFVKNNQSVKQGDILGFIESNANAKEILDLSKRLDNSVTMLGQGRPQSITSLFDRRFTGLGELQASYQAFIVALQLYNDYLVNGFYSRRSVLLQNDILALQNMRQKLTQQKNFTQNDNELAKRTFEMNESLFKEKVISAEEFRQAQSVFLSKQKVDQQIDISIIAQQNQISNKQKEIDQMNHDIVQQQQTFEQALQTLKSNVDAWLSQYVLFAPVRGTIEFAFPIQENRYIESGKLLGYINPPNSKYYVEIKLTQANFGKVDTGMKVQLRFDAYPYQEAGFVPGTLDYISNVAVDSGFSGSVQLDNGLITNQKKSIPYKTGLKAQALIITKDMRLLQRIYYSIVKATSVSK